MNTGMFRKVKNMEKELEEKINLYFRKGIRYKSDLQRKLLLQIRGQKCEICGITEWNNKPISLQCHHIDGDHTNNQLSNLLLVCPNCHSQTEHYKGKERIKRSKVSVEEILALASQCYSINDLLNKLDLAGGGNYHRVKKIVEQYNVIFKSKPIIIKQKNSNKSYYSKQNKENLTKQRIQQIQNCDIDFSKYGWVVKVANMWNVPSSTIHRWFKRHMPQFYIEKCFHKKS